MPVSKALLAESYDKAFSKNLIHVLAEHLAKLCVHVNVSMPAEFVAEHCAPVSRSLLAERLIKLRAYWLRFVC